MVDGLQIEPAASGMKVECLHAGWPKNGANPEVCEGSPLVNSTAPWSLQVSLFHPSSSLCIDQIKKSLLLFLIHCYVCGTGKYISKHRGE